MPIWKEEVALVTGIGSGIGRAAALGFAQEGAIVLGCDIQKAAGEETVGMIHELGQEAAFIETDVSRPDAVEHLVVETLRRFGRIDFAFNNAGIEGILANTVDCTEENWDRTLDVNLKSVWLCMKHELKHMLERRSGAIVNCSSVAGLVGFPGLPAYVASKHGIIGLTRTAALECARQGIRVNAICPGVIRTAMVDRLTKEHPELPLAEGEPIGRMGRPEEVAAAAIWLCSGHASFVTGQAFAVDGGWVAQ